MILITVGSQKFQFNRLLSKIDELIEKKVITDKVFAQIGVSDYKPKNYEFQDTAVNTTRQLDYYRNLGCNSTNMELTKKYTTNNNNIGWWLRTSSSSSQYNFQYSSGYVSSYLSNSNFWICPTFRIG